MNSQNDSTDRVNEEVELWAIEREQFIAIVQTLGMSHEDLASRLNIKFESYKQALQPSRPFPKWARAFSIGHEATGSALNRILNGNLKPRKPN
ncbi:MAG: hypothetical protein RIC06_25685 [Cyclobacteriaceae bacterium]